MKRFTNRTKQAGWTSLYRTMRLTRERASEILDQPDAHHLSGAIGWLELGSWQEAGAELERISAPRRKHPEVMETEYHVCALGGRWMRALTICRNLIVHHPERPFGWLHQSVALNELKRTEEAYSKLFSIQPRFPDNSLILYCMACFACKMGHEIEASAWLKRAFDVGDAFQLMGAALNEPDLKPLWSRLGMVAATC